MGRIGEIPVGNFIPQPQHKLFWSAGLPRGCSRNKSWRFGGVHSVCVLISIGWECEEEGGRDITRSSTGSLSGTSWPVSSEITFQGFLGSLEGSYLSFRKSSESWVSDRRAAYLESALDNLQNHPYIVYLHRYFLQANRNPFLFQTRFQIQFLSMRGATRLTLFYPQNDPSTRSYNPLESWKETEIVTAMNFSSETYEC